MPKEDDQLKYFMKQIEIYSPALYKNFIGKFLKMHKITWSSYLNLKIRLIEKGTCSL